MRRTTFLVIALVGATACGGSQPKTKRALARTNTTADAKVPATKLEPSRPQTAEGVTPMEVACAAGTPEQCNAVDDDCNGRIDEGCGYESGPVQVTLAWNSGADIDLYVTEPSGETLSHGHTHSGSGGRLDHAARGDCAPTAKNARIENVFWPRPDPPKGEYKVTLHYWGECNSNAGPTTTSVSVVVGGTSLGAFNYTLAPNEKVTVLEFTLR